MGIEVPMPIQASWPLWLPYIVCSSQLNGGGTQHLNMCIYKYILIYVHLKSPTNGHIKKQVHPKCEILQLAMFDYHGYHIIHSINQPQLEVI